jgi:hypothetical protein
MSKRTDTKKLVFLFGAGSSVPAGCRTAKQITDNLAQILHKDKYVLSEYPWLESLWELVRRHAVQTSMTMGRFLPNFEHLVCAVELLEEYADTFRLPDRDATSTINELGKALGFPTGVEAYAALSYALMQISSDAQLVNPIGQLFQLKGTSAKYMWAAKALRKLISDQFPTQYDLSYLTPFREVLLHDSREIVVATLNYDLVLDEFFRAHNIPYEDGFANGEEPAPWRGFGKSDPCVTYLKLHGSLNWFQIRREWFSKEQAQLSANEIYKCEKLDINHLLKKELSQKQKINEKYKYEFNNPYLIMGGSKDRKVLDIPFIEIGREWVNSLALTDTLVIVGTSYSDFHLLQQIKGTLINNRYLDKVICINPDRSTNEAYGILLRSVTGSGKRPYMFFIDTHWDFQRISAEYKLPLKEILSLHSDKLMQHFREA